MTLINWFRGRKPSSTEEQQIDAFKDQNRALTDRLIEEQRSANAQARDRMTQEIPQLKMKYLQVMESATAIMRSG